MTATMAASALAIGLRVDAAQSLTPANPLGGKIGNPDTSIQLVQQRDKDMPGGGGPSIKGGGQGMKGNGGQGGPSMKGGGGQGGPSMQGGGLRQGGSQFRPERGAREGREFREGGGRGFRPRGGERSGGVIIEGGPRRRGGGVIIERGYGYRPADCGWLRRRALATDSLYWWNRYRACRG
jgi:hypothetical protein